MEYNYLKELKALRVNENNISFFKNLIDKEIWNNVEERKEVLDTVITYCNKYNLDVAKAWMLYYLAWHYSEEDDSLKAIEMLKAAKDTFRYYENNSGLLYVYNGLVFMYCDLGQYIIANEYGVLGIKLSNETGEEDGLCKILLSTSIANTYSGDYVYAKELLQLVEKKYLNNNISENDKRIYYKTSIEVDLNLGKTDNVLKNIETLRDSIYLSKEYFQIPELHKLRGLYFMTMNMTEQAEEEFKISNDISEQKGYLLQQCESGLYWAKLKFKTNNFVDAVNLLRNILAIAVDNKFQRIVKSVSFMLYDYYKGVGDYNESLKYLELYTDEVDNIAKYHVEDESESNISKYSREINLSNILDNKNEIISRIGEKILSTLDLRDLLYEINIEMRKLVSLDFLGLALVDEEKDLFNVVTMEFDVISEIESVEIIPNTTFSDICMRSGKAIIINDIRKEYNKYFNSVDLTNAGVTDPISLAFFPLKFNKKVIGVLLVQSLKENAYSNEDIYTMRIISSYLAISLNNALKYKNVEEEANYDSITGFLTKREIIKELKNTIIEYREKKDYVCVAMMDLDNLKYINDKYGHIAGDELISAISKKVRKQIRQTDSIGRYGGDEFLLISTGLNREESYTFLDNLRKSVCNTIINIEGHNIKASITIGAYMLDGSKTTDLEVIQAADSALYTAKEKGKNIVLFL